MPNTPIVSAPQEEADSDPAADLLMARTLRRLCRERGVTRDDIRAALPDLTAAEFAALWAGKRTVYVTEAMRINRVFEPEPNDWIYPSAISNALDAVREVTK